MRVGIVVDGVSEFASFPPLLERLRTASGLTYLKVVKADIQPLAPIPVMAKACQGVVRQLCARGADLVIVLVDREPTGACPVGTAQTLALELATRVDCRVSVVVKDITFENWLLADPTALRGQKMRFKVTKATLKKVEPNKADNANAADLIRRSTIGSAYDKVEDAKRILARADPSRMGSNSRSFRKFLREAGHPSYATQSRNPQA